MFNGSHSRSSYPLDKRLPRMPKRERHNNYGYTYYVGFSSSQRQVEKKMHKKKQRQHNSLLSRTYMVQD